MDWAAPGLEYAQDLCPRRIPPFGIFDLENSGGAMVSDRTSKDGNGSRYWKTLAIGVIVTGIVGVFLFNLTRSYVIRQAEKNIQNLLLSHRGIHLYIQRMMHPALYDFKEKGDIPDAFYAPELFSSSFIVRNQHQFYNEARVEAGLQEVYYKMAAVNPRNPLNMADAQEKKLISMFNENQDLKSHSDIMELDGKKYLYFAMPFLKTRERCLKCHGIREVAPVQLRERYKGPGGFHDWVGNIRAIESIRAPLQEEYYTVYIICAALLSGFLVILALFSFNRRLRITVSDRTSDLEQEIVERRRAEEEIIKLNQELEHRVRKRTVQLTAANKELDAFAYSVSHDLRAPLRGIDGFSSALLEDYGDKLDEEGRKYLDRVKSGCKRMGNLIDDLLQMSRLSRGEIHKKTLDLSAMAHAVIENLRESEPRREIRVEIKPELSAFGDPTLMQAVLENLLGNAWKFTSKTGKPEIAFGVAEENGRPVFYVKDNGAGFNMAYADKLFGAFQRLHSPGEFEGTGIGLATVQRIIHRHGGWIRAEAEENKGATFYFAL